MRKIEAHPDAAVFPMMSADELADLAADIKANGQRFPIMLGKYENREVIVDGRNRYEACEIAGVEPKFEQLNGHDPKAFILSVNINRRHMSAGQRAMATAMIYPEPEKRGRGNKSVKDLDPKSFSRARLSQARTVLRYSRPLAETVLAGSKPLDVAYSETQQQAAVMQSNEMQLARLRTEAPDLADLVAEERMKLSDAIAALNERKSEEAALEQNRRETLLRVTSSGYRCTVAWANNEFVQSLRDRLGDDGFRHDLLRSLRLKSSEIANIQPGAAALAEVLSQLANQEHLDE